MPSAEILTIGTEILLGEIVDTNASFIARAFRDVGIDVFRKTTIGDNPNRIAIVIQEALTRCEIIITTGGLGPTVDDPTRQAVAMAFHVELEYHPELWDQIVDRFNRFKRIPTENNRQQAYIPSGAVGVENPVGTAPAFYFEEDNKTLVALPGVPKEMEYLLMNYVIPYLQDRYKLQGLIKTRTLHTAGVGESHIDSLISDLEKLNNPTVGLAAHSGQVDIRIAAKADSDIEAENLISSVEQKIRLRLGDMIYGVDEETLEQVAIQKIKDKGWQIVIIEAGLSGRLIQKLAPFNTTVIASNVIPPPYSSDQLLEITRNFQELHKTQAAFGVSITIENNLTTAHFCLITPDNEEMFIRNYGGVTDNAPWWAMHNSLDILRRI